MKLNNWFLGRRARVAMTSGVAAILFAVFGASADAQVWNNAGGSGLWFDGTNWVGGVAPTGTSADAIVGAPAPVTLNGSVNLNSLTVTADGIVNLNPSLNLDFGGTATTTLNNAGIINAGNNTDFQFQNNVVNSGNININATASATDIEIDSANASLSGGGTVTLNGNNARINGASGAILTVVDQTIQGQGSIGTNTIQVINQTDGLIDANVSGQILNVDVNSSGLTNQGTMQASGGGILQYTGSVVDNTGGQIIAQDGSIVRMGASTFSGGTLDTVGTGQIIVNDSTTVGYDSVTLNGNLTTGNNSDLDISNTITNNGQITVAAGASTTDIEVQTGGATLTGSGKVVLSGANAGITGNSGQILTIGDHTIEGQGSIGRNAIGVVNSSDGVIDANVAAQTLNIDVATAGLQNEGTITSSNGGNLRIASSTVNNVGGLIEAGVDSTVSLSASTIEGGVINSVGTGQVNVEASTTVRLENLSNTGKIVSFNNSDLDVEGTITNSGMIDVQAGVSGTDIEVQSGNATLTGGGTVKLTGANAGINGVSGAVLTVGDQTIEGQGDIGDNVMGVVNSADGLINANVAGGLLNIDANSSDDFINDGTLRASNEGTLRLTGTELTNNSVVEALADSTVELNSSQVTGGTLRSVGTGTIDLLASTSSDLTDVTLEGKFQAFNNSDTQISGTINNTGVMDILATVSSTDIEVQSGGATLTGGGTVTLSDNNAGIDGASGTTLTIGDQTIEGQGSIGKNVIGILNSADGLIDANVSGMQLNIDSSTSGGVTNNGTMRSSDSGVLRFTGSEVTNNRVIEALDASTVELNSSSITGGTLRSVGTGTVDLLGSTSSRLEDVTLEGSFRSFNNSDTEILGTINNIAEMDILATVSATDLEVQTGGATLVGGGTVRLSGTNARINGTSGETLDIASQLVIGEGNIGGNLLNIINGAGGTIESDVSGGVLTIDTVGSNSTTFFTNDGTLRASNSSLLDSLQGVINNGTIDVAANSEIEARTLQSSVGSLISGNGSVDVDFGPINVAGTVAPGASAGTLAFLDDTAFAATAMLEAELESASLFDVLQVQGELSLDGILSVDLLGGFDPTMADTFLIATATEGIFGEFSNVTDGGLLLTEGGEGTFVVSYTGGGVELSNFTLTAIPEPGSAAWLAGLGIAVLMKRRRKA